MGYLYPGASIHPAVSGPPAVLARPAVWLTPNVNPSLGSISSLAELIQPTATEEVLRSSLSKSQAAVQSFRTNTHFSLQRRNLWPIGARLIIIMRVRHPIAGAGALLAFSSCSHGFNPRGVCNKKYRYPNTALGGELARSEKEGAAGTSVNDALALLNEAKALRAQASALQQQLDREKEERIRREREKVDSLIDALLFHGTTSDATPDDEDAKQKSKQQLLHTEEQVASLLISKRLNYEMVNQMFDRIVDLSNRPQSIDSCSPLLSLLLDAACKVDCLEREDNPNKRWNHRVERDLRRKLFALGYGIRIEDVEKKNDIRSITGEKDYY